MYLLDETKLATAAVVTSKRQQFSTGIPKRDINIDKQSPRTRGGV